MLSWWGWDSQVGSTPPTGLAGTAHPENSIPDPNTVARVLWANFELGGELWSTGGFAFRYFFGYGRALLATPTTAHPDLDWNIRAYDVPYVGLGFGYAF